MITIKLSKLRSSAALTYLIYLIAYYLISLVITRSLGHNFTNQVFQQSGDPNTFIMFLKFWPWSIINDHNPFLFKTISYPATYNCAWLTSVSGPALVGSPFTLIWGPAFTWNLFLISAQPLACFFTALMLLEIGIDKLGSFLCGLLFGYNSYENSQLLGHLHLILIFPLPLALLLFLRRLKHKSSRKSFVILTALDFAFLILTSTELAASFVVFALIGILVFLIFLPRRTIFYLKELFKELIYIMFLLALLLFPFIYYLIKGLSIASGTPINPPLYFSANLLNLIIPTKVTLLGGSTFLNISANFHGSPVEADDYFGILLLAVLIFALAEKWYKNRFIWAISLLCVIIALSLLGPYLTIDAATTSFVLPWRILYNLPGFKDLLPVRFSIYLFLIASVVLGIWYSWAKTKIALILRFSVILAIAVSLLPNPFQYYWKNSPVPPYVQNGELERFIGQGSSVLPIAEYDAFFDNKIEETWIADNNFSYSLTESPFGYDPYKPPASYYDWPIIVFNQFPIPDALTQIAMFAAGHGDSSILVFDKNRFWSSTLLSSGWKYRSFGNYVRVFKVPKAIMAEFRASRAKDAFVHLYTAEVSALLKGARCYYEKVGSINNLNPFTAASIGCISTTYVISPDNHYGNFYSFLSPRSSEIAVAISTDGKIASDVFANFPNAAGFYLYKGPIIKQVTPAEMKGLGEGLFMATFNP